MLMSVASFALLFGSFAGAIPISIQPGATSELVYSEVVRSDGSQWLRVKFAAIDLVNDSDFVKITGLKEGLTQTLTKKTAVWWGNSTAYFNGDAIQIDVFSANKNTIPNVKVGTVMTHAKDESESDDVHIESVCYSPDTRVFSNDYRQGRYVYGTNDKCCTAWQIDDVGHCYLTAGHCSDSGDGVVEYNVPLSTDGGILQHAAPEHQYPVDQSSMQTEYPETDYRYFGVFRNSETGLLPTEAYGDVYYETTKAEQVYAPQDNANLVIIGYGENESFPKSHRRTQKIASGPFTRGDLNSRVYHRVDTSNGNSGSAILDTTTGLAIGIHTNGGCELGKDASANFGVGILHPAVQKALNSPKGVCAVPPEEL